MSRMTMRPLGAWLVSRHDWRTTLQIVAGIVAVIMIPVSLLGGRPSALPAASGGGAPRALPAPSAEGSPGSLPNGESPADMSVGEAVRSPQFIILLLTNFFCCA